MGRLDISKDFIENSDYLRQLASELRGKSIKDIDSNLLYEVAYADTYLDVLLSKSNCVTLNKELLDSKSVFDTILASTSYEEVDKLKSSFDYKKLLKCRYDNVENASFDKSYALIGEANALRLYFQSSISKLGTLALFILIAIVDKYSILEKIWGILQLRVDALESFGVLMTSLLSLAALLGAMTMCIGISLDLLYITVPMMQAMVQDSLKYSNKENSFISRIALDCVDACMGENVIYTKVKSYDRIERNKVWLDSMLEVLEYSEGHKDLYNILVDLSSSIKKAEVEGRKNKSYYLDIAKIEFLHDKYLQIV